MAWVRFRKKDMPGGLWGKCKSCSEMIFTKDLVAHYNVCPKCGFHMPATVDQRVQFTCDEGSFEELYTELMPVDRLEFKDKTTYQEKLEATRKKVGRNEAMTIGVGRVKGHEVVLGVMNFDFLGGSMGVVVGEKVTIAVEMAMERGVPLILVSASGGARMHEGALSLMQMAKTCSALARLDEHGGLYISVLTNPTTGGVTASFATMADVILAEPGALIGFAGPRVIQNTIKQELPEGFQRSEFLLARGQIDAIVRRDELRDHLARLIEYLHPRAHAPVAAEPRIDAASTAGAGSPRGDDGAADDPLPPVIGQRARNGVASIDATRDDLTAGPLVPDLPASASELEDALAGVIEDPSVAEGDAAGDDPSGAPTVIFSPADRAARRARKNRFENGADEIEPDAPASDADEEKKPEKGKKKRK